MTVKKSLLAVATASAVAIAGAGVSDGTWDLGTGMDDLDNSLKPTGLVVDNITAEARSFLPR